MPYDTWKLLENYIRRISPWVSRNTSELFANFSAIVYN